MLVCSKNALFIEEQRKIFEPKKHSSTEKVFFEQKAIFEQKRILQVKTRSSSEKALFEQKGVLQTKRLIFLGMDLDGRLR